MTTEEIIAKLIDDHAISGMEAVTMMKDLFVNRFIKHDDSISVKPEVPKPGDVHVKYGIREPMIAVAYGITDPWKRTIDDAVTTSNVYKDTANSFSFTTTSNGDDVLKG